VDITEMRRQTGSLLVRQPSTPLPKRNRSSVSFKRLSRSIIGDPDKIMKDIHGLPIEDEEGDNEEDNKKMETIPSDFSESDITVSENNYLAEVASEADNIIQFSDLDLTDAIDIDNIEDDPARIVTDDELRVSSLVISSF